jgi:hypothetical protein
MLRCGSQDLAIKPFRRAELAGLLKPHGLQEELLIRWRPGADQSSL